MTPHRIEFWGGLTGLLILFLLGCRFWPVDESDMTLRQKAADVIRQMNIAGMSDLALTATRESVARAAGVSGDPDHLIEDIDAELARRNPGISREVLARMTGDQLADLRRAMVAEMTGMTDPGNLAYGQRSLASIDAELARREPAKETR